MVALKAQQAASLLKSPPRDFKAALFFGTDPGMVNERAGQLAKLLAERETPAGEVVRIDDTELDEDAGRLDVELNTRPMFSGRRIVRATAGRRVSADLLQPILSRGELEGLLVVEAGNLKPDDKLRSLFEKSPGLIAVACYPDSAEDLEDLTRDVLAAAGLEIDPDAMMLLQSRLGADRAMSRAELDKLALYCMGRSRITLEDVDASVGDAADLALEQIAEAAADGRTAASVSDYGRALASGESAQTIILVLQRYFLKLHKIRSEVDAGQRLDEALRSLRPPLYFKQRDTFARQVRAWPRGDLDKALKRISEAAKAARLSSHLEDALCERLVLALAAMASGLRAAASAGR